MKNRTILLAFIAATAFAGTAAFADDPLDQALNQKPKPTALNPEIAGKHDDTDLTNDLTNGKKEQPAQQDANKIIADATSHMKSAGDNLKDRADAGADTQDHQRKALIALDTMIEMAKKKDQQGKGSGTGKPQDGDAKQQNPGEGEQPGDHQDGGTTAAQKSTLPGGSTGPVGSNGEMIVRDPSQWGNLSPKQRDEIINDLQDGGLKTYQEKIRKYYESLAEIGRGR